MKAEYLSNEYLNKGKEVLKAIMNNGYEAYFIGDVVIKFILKKNTTRVDIVTSAQVQVIQNIFKDHEITKITDSGLTLTHAGYVFNIQTFVQAEGTDDNTLLSKHYSKNLMDDLANRDYTINAIAMSHNGKLIDAYDGYNDVMKKRVAHIGNARIRFSKNPSLMVKAFALMSQLGYKLTNKTKKAITKRRRNLDKVQVSEYYEELKNIFEGPNAKKAIRMMDKTNFERSLPSLRKTIRRLSAHYKKVNMEEVLLMAFVLDGKIDDRYQYCIENYLTFVTIFTLASANKKAKYDLMTLYANGLEVCLEANRINYLLGRCSNKEKKIRKQWEKLSVKKVCDLEYKGQDIMRIIHEYDFPRINEILDDVVLSVLNGEITNNRVEIERLVLKLLEKNNIHYDLNGITDVQSYMAPEKPIVEDFVMPREEINIERTGDPMIDGLTSHRLDMLEQRFEEQSRLLREKEIRLQEMEDLKLRNDVDVVVNKSIEYISNSDGLRYMVRDTEGFKEQLSRFIFDYVKEEGDS